MPQLTENGFVDSLLLRFDGGLAHVGEIELNQLALSLEGWDQFLRLTTSSLIEGRLSGSTEIDGALLDIRASAIERGSFDVYLTMAVSGIIGGAAWGTVKGLWPFVRAVYRAHLDAKQQQMELEFAAEQLRQAVAYTMVADRDESASNEHTLDFARSVDEALAEVALPVTRSVESVSLQAPAAEVVIAISRRDALLLRRPFGIAQPIRPVSGLQHRVIRLLQLNLANGWGRFQFIEPNEPFETRQQECKINDPELGRPHNMYTRSMDDRTPIGVDLSLVIREDSKIRSHYWNIFGPNSAIADGLAFRPEPESSPTRP